MDQNAIDELLKSGSFAEEDNKQQEIYENLTSKTEETDEAEVDFQAVAESIAAEATGVAAATEPVAEPVTETAEPEPTPQQAAVTEAQKRGKVMGQISKVTEASEEGTNLVMNYLDKVLTLISQQNKFIGDISKLNENCPGAVDVAEVMQYLKEYSQSIENTIFDAMDAFQFQDINRQKLMKVMYTLAKLNEYLNDLLGYEADKPDHFGHQIDNKTMVSDQDKSDVDQIINDFQGGQIDASAAVDDEHEVTGSRAAASVDADLSDVDKIIADFNSQQK